MKDIPSKIYSISHKGDCPYYITIITTSGFHNILKQHKVGNYYHIRIAIIYNTKRSCIRIYNEAKINSILKYNNNIFQKGFIHHNISI